MFSHPATTLRSFPSSLFTTVVSGNTLHSVGDNQYNFPSSTLVVLHSMLLSAYNQYFATWSPKRFYGVHYTMLSIRCITHMSVKAHPIINEEVTNKMSNCPVVLSQFWHDIKWLCHRGSSRQKIRCHRCQPSRNRAGNPAFWRISRIFSRTSRIFGFILRNNFFYIAIIIVITFGARKKFCA